MSMGLPLPRESELGRVYLNPESSVQRGEAEAPSGRKRARNKRATQIKKFNSAHKKGYHCHAHRRDCEAEFREQQKVVGMERVLWHTKIDLETGRGVEGEVEVLREERRYLDGTSYGQDYLVPPAEEGASP